MVSLALLFLFFKIMDIYDDCFDRPFHVGLMGAVREWKYESKKNKHNNELDMSSYSRYCTTNPYRSSTLSESGNYTSHHKGSMNTEDVKPKNKKKKNMTFRQGNNVVINGNNIVTVNGEVIKPDKHGNVIISGGGGGPRRHVEKEEHSDFYNHMSMLFGLETLKKVKEKIVNLINIKIYIENGNIVIKSKENEREIE